MFSGQEKRKLDAFVKGYGKKTNILRFFTCELFFQFKVTKFRGFFADRKEKNHGFLGNDKN